MVQPLLFNKKGDLDSYLANRKTTLRNELANMESSYVLNASEVDLCQYFISKYSLNSPVLREHEIYQHTPSEVDIDVSQDPRRAIFDRSRPFYIKGTSFTIAIPFDGDPDLFHYKPSTLTYNPPRGEIKNQEVHLVYQTTGHDSESIKQEYRTDLNELKRYLVWVAQGIDTFNKSLESFVTQAVTQRKEKLLADQGLAGALGIPIRRRDDAPRTYALPNIRRKPKIERPKVQTGTFVPEPALPMQEYEYILDIIQNMVLVMERSPRAFAGMQEEDLRQHFLVQLNGHYEGQATGETFNYEGKTDILIRHEGKNVFIAECKFWTGEKELLKAINQLLGYTSWRDTKTAILLFNRGKDFSRVLEKTPPAIKSHSCFKRELGLKEETIFRYLFHQPDDTNRELILTVMGFNVPAK